MGQSVSKSGAVVLGGGHAGAQAVQSLRQFGFDGSIHLICDEAVLPYQRPPLSKAYMKGEVPADRLFFKPPDWYAANRIDVMLGERAVAIERDRRKVRLASGAALGYDKLVIATGSRARRLALPGAELPGIFYLRNLRDVDEIRSSMEAGRKLVIIGGGFIGLEAAAVARDLDLEVTILESAGRLLERVTSPVVSRFFQEFHQMRGVSIHLDAAVEYFGEENGALSYVALQGGQKIPADLVLVGIGAVVNAELAADADLDAKEGIVVDEDARTADPRIFAAGDCTLRPLDCYKRAGRLESVHNAGEQGKLAAAAISGSERPRIDCPWFWSDQAGVKLQIAGLSQGYDNYAVRGAPEDEKFSVFYLRDGVVIGADAINSPQEFIAAKKLVMSGARVPRSVLQDVSTTMRELVSAV